MFQFYLDKNKELDNLTLSRLLRKFESAVKPALQKYKDYYDGNQEIMRKVPADPTRPCNRIMTNFCKQIVQTFQGYSTGLPISYSSVDDTDISPLLDVFNENDIINSDSVFLRNGLKYGRAFQLVYVDEQGNKRFKNVDSTNVIPVYANDLDEHLMYVIYYAEQPNWDNDETRKTYSIDVYDAVNIYHYQSESFFNNITVSAPPEPHYIGKVPWAIFNLNEDCESIFDDIISLQDAYNNLLSDEVDDFESFVDAYMVLKNVSASPEDLKQMKETRTILIDGEDDVSYLTKNISDTQVENMLSNIKHNIHTISNAPDFGSSDFNSGVQSGTAIAYKLIGFSNIAYNTESQLRKALQDRIDLLNNISGLIDGSQYNVKIEFNHNMPSNLTDIVDVVNGLRGLVSDETLLAQIPFVENVSDEMERVQQENETNISMYSFDNHTTQEVRDFVSLQRGAQVMVNEEDTEE